MPAPEHVQNLDRALQELEIVLDELFSPELAPLFRDASQAIKKRIGNEALMKTFADAGAARLQRALIDGGYYDDKPDAAAASARGLERSAFGFRQALAGVSGLKAERDADEDQTPRGGTPETR